MKKLLLFRLYDPTYSRNGNYGNKKTLSVYLNNDNTIGYSFFGDWQYGGTPFAISNLQLQESLPMTPRPFKTIADLEKEIRTVLRTGVGSRAVAKVEVLNDL